MFGLAERLHKTLAEIEQMSVDEFMEWVAYFRLTESNEAK